MNALPPAMVSYSSRDRPAVVALVECLRAAGMDVWQDAGGIEAGTDWAGRIIDAIDRAQVVIVCLSGHSCASEEVFREISYASSGKKRFIPVLMEAVELPSRLKYHLAGVQLVSLHQLGPEKAAEEILRGLAVLFGEAPAAPAPTALPEPPNAIIGREREIDELAQLIQKQRLVTLTGPGGTGKTRLSIAVARQVAASFPGGAWFVELAAITQPRAIHPAITRTLGLREAETGAVLEALRVFLRDREALFVLDNFEQITGGAGEIATLMKQCPTVRILVSSRIPLRVYGEHEYPVSPLGVPPPNLQEIEEIAQSGAVQLFLERARAVRPNLALDAANAQAIAGICRRLDGLPLALELAAARVRMLAPPALATRLAQSLDLLTGGAKDLPARQQTLRGAIAWSYDLLSADERGLFELLGVFSGGFGLAAVEAVAASFTTALPFDLLATLVESSLVKAGGDDGRFRMLEMIREFASERLLASEHSEGILGAHRAYFLAQAEAAAPQLFGKGQAESLVQIEADLDNFRAVIERALEAQDTGTALRMGAALWYFWAIRGYFNEGRERIGAALATAVPTEPDLMRARATCLNASAMLTYFQGDYRRMIGLAEECIALAGEHDPHNHAFGLAVLGVAAYCAGEAERGRTASAQGLRQAEALGDLWVQGFAWNVTAIINYMDGHLQPEPWENAHRILTSVNDRYWGTYPRIGLGFVLQTLDRYPDSAPLFREALRVCHSMGNLRGIALSLAGLGGVQIRLGNAEAAARLFGASAAIRDSIRSPIPAIYRPVCERNEAELKGKLEPALEERERSAGARATLATTVAAALS